MAGGLRKHEGKMLLRHSLPHRRRNH